MLTQRRVARRCLLLAILLALATMPMRVGADEQPPSEITWEWQLGGGLNGFDFIDEDNGWAVGDFGLVIVTHDGGVTWECLDTPTLNDLNDVAFIDLLHGWVVGDDGIVLATQDGGQTWAAQTITAGELRKVDFLDDQFGWTSGWLGDSLLYVTSDGGSTWTEVDTPSRRVVAATFVSPTRGWFISYGYVSGPSGGIYATQDGGQSWERQLEREDGLRAIAFVDANHGWVAEDLGTLRTTDGGETWTGYPAGCGVNVYKCDIAFVDKDHGLIVGSSRDYKARVLVTKDGGDSWGVITLDYWALQQVDFVTPEIGWALGSETLFATQDGGTNWAMRFYNPRACVYDMQFFNQHIGGVVGNPDRALFTFDGGNTWHYPAFAYPVSDLVSDPVIVTMYAISFTLPHRGWVAGRGYWEKGLLAAILKTYDSGTTWPEAQLIESGFELHDIYAVDDNHAWAVGTWGKVYRTTNGETWEMVDSGATDLYGVHFVDIERGWAVGWHGTIITSDDTGLTWSPQSSGTTTWLKSAYFTDDSNGWVVGDGVILKTSDGGETWNTVPGEWEQEGWYLQDVFFLDTNDGWAVGEDGRVLVTHDGGDTWTTHTVDPPIDLYALAATDLHHVWVAGDWGFVFKAAPPCDLPCDLDWNGVVDVFDIMLVASRWRCQRGEDCYVEYCDLNGDGRIDIVDIMIVAACWGEKCE